MILKFGMTDGAHRLAWWMIFHLSSCFVWVDTTGYEMIMVCATFVSGAGRLGVGIPPPLVRVQTASAPTFCYPGQKAT